MTLCPNCHKETREDSKFCRWCGSEVRPPAPMHQAEETAVLPMNAQDAFSPIDGPEQPVKAQKTETSSRNPFEKADEHNTTANHETEKKSHRKKDEQTGTGAAFAFVGDDSPQNEAASSVPHQMAKEPVSPPERAAELCPTFAEGLPSWDLVPPSIMVNRKRGRR